MLGMKGALPTKYIVGLVFAVVIIALIGYWFYSEYIKGGKTASEAYCRAKQIEYCTMVMANDPNVLDKSFTEFVPECKSFDWATDFSKEDCPDILQRRSNEE